MIKNIVFDIGNVLVHFNWQGFLASYHFPEEKYHAIANAMFLSPNWNLLDEGKLSYPELLDLFTADAPQYAEEIADVLSSFGASITQFPYAKPWLAALKKEGLHLYYLSNYAEFTKDNTKAALDFCELMDGGLMSYQVQLIKPNPAFFQCLFQKYDLLPEECVFIDDNKANIRQASVLGMHTILFRDYPTALKELAQLRCQELSAHCTNLTTK